MRIIASLLILAGAGLIAGPMAAARIEKGAARPAAHADVTDAKGATVATARFTQMEGGLRLVVDAKGLPPGMHGIHLHGVGLCEAPDYKSAGAHWNPMGRMHGLESPQGAHAGDLPNLRIGADGSGHLDTMIKGATLTGGHEPVLDADGTALVIHADPDDNHTDPAGNSGGRIACGVVRAG